MSEAARPKIDEGFGGLTRWEVFVDRHLRKKDGSARSDRNARLLARKHGFGRIRIGQIDFIDEAKEARRLRDEVTSDRTPRRRGRPRTGDAAE